MTSGSVRCRVEVSQTGPAHTAGPAFFRLEDIALDIYNELDLHDCPFCGGPGLLEEEQGWCFYVMCLDCGAETAPLEYDTPDARPEAARSAARLWNLGKVIRKFGGD